MAYIRKICLFHHLFFGQKDYVWYIAKKYIFSAIWSYFLCIVVFMHFLWSLLEVG